MDETNINPLRECGVRVIIRLVNGHMTHGFYFKMSTCWSYSLLYNKTSLLVKTRSFSLER